MKGARYITLTEAMTEMSEGLAQRADAHIESRNAKERGRQERFLESARARARALLKAGLDSEAFSMAEPNALITGPLPEIAAHQALSIAHILERDEEIKRLWQAGRTVVEAATRGELVLRGRADGDGSLEKIDTAELCYLAFNEQTGFDTLYNRDTGYSWTQITLERAQFVKWHRVQNMDTGPTIAAELRAVGLLTERLQANKQLTREDGMVALHKAAIPFTNKGFLTRIWPEARVKAGLPARGRAGRPPKSKTQID